MSSSIGSLYIDIIARTQSLEADMAKVKAQMNSLSSGMGAAGGAADEMGKKITNAMGTSAIEKFTARFILYRLFHDVVNEIKYVIDNIEKIPGMPAEAVQSVQEFRINLMEARQTLDSFIGEAIAGFSIFAKSVGAGAAAILGYEDGLDDAFKAQLESLDKIHASLDPAYYDKVRAARTKLSEAIKAESVAELSAGQKVLELRKQAQAYETAAKSNSIDSLQRTQDQIKASELRAQANKNELEVKKQYAIFRQRFDTDEIRDDFTMLSQKDKMLQLEQKIGAAMAQVGIYQAHEVGKPFIELSIDQMEAANKKFPQLLEWMQLYRAELQKIKSASQEWADMTVRLGNDLDNYLTSLVTGGKVRIQDFLKQISDAIIQTFFKLAVINPLLNAMFGSTKGFGILPALFGIGAKASGGPGAGLTLVGEQGPELVNLPSGSSVIPAGQTASMLSRSSKGNVYQIDARGADAGAVDRLERLLLALAGPGVVEKRAVNSVFNVRTRGGGMAAAVGA